MKLVEQYYGTVRRHLNESFSERESFFMGYMECYIKVEVNGRFLHIKQFFHREIPAKVALRECRKAIMAEVEREVFGE